MLLTDLTVKAFLDTTASNEPVPGGGSVAALSGALASALGQMVAALTIGRKKYVDAEPLMREIAQELAPAQQFFTNAITEDAESYDKVMQAFKLPKETDQEKAARAEAIEKATEGAAMVPLTVARKAVEIMPRIAQAATQGNRNAVTDACTAMLMARAATRAAVLNVKINLASLSPDNELRGTLEAECDALLNSAEQAENQLMQTVNL